MEFYVMSIQIRYGGELTVRI